MIISTKELIENKDKLNDIIGKEKTLINLTIANQEKLKIILLNYMQKLAYSTEEIDVSFADNILTILDDFKKSLDLFKTNVDLLNNLLKQLDNILVETEDKDHIAEIIENFNASFLTDGQTISENTLQIETVLYSVLPYSNLTFFKEDACQHSEKIDTNIPVQDLSPTSDIMEDKAKEEITQVSKNSSEKDDNELKNNDTSHLAENTLIISDIKNKVFLPYTIELLNSTLKNNPDKYTSIEDVIEKEYTLSIDSFKNPALARFREGFKLIRSKEKKSIIEAFDLGMELTFNYNLHPAIITACRNLDELDIYLDYLENNETDKFDCFKIVFEIAPIVSKKGRH